MGTKKEKIILREVFRKGTAEEFIKGLNKLDDISEKLKLSYTIEKLKYDELREMNNKLGTLISLQRGYIK